MVFEVEDITRELPARPSNDGAKSIYTKYVQTKILIIIIMANTTNKTKESKFIATLKRTNSKIRNDRAVRIGTKVANAQDMLIMKLEEKIMSYQDQLDAMMDLSTDNQTTSMNIVSQDFNPGQYVEKINSLKTEIELIGVELKIAKETRKDLFS